MAEEDPNIRAVKRLEVAATSDGSGIVLVMQTVDGETSAFVLHAEKIATLTTNLLRLCVTPEVSAHVKAEPIVAAGEMKNFRPFPVSAVSVTFVPILPAVGLLIDLPGGIRLPFQFSANDGEKLSRDLQRAVQRAKANQPQAKQ